MIGPADPPRERRLLVVEDNPFNQRIVGLMLTRLGYPHDFAASGEEALTAAASAYDLVIMDLQLPGIDGAEATRQIRCGDGPNRDIPIVGLTATAAAAEVQTCLDSGMNTVLAKPIKAEKLADTLARFLPPA